MASPEEVSGSHALTTAEQLFCTLTEWHERVSVYVIGAGIANLIGAKCNVYAVNGSQRTLLATGRVQGNGTVATNEQVMMSANQGSVAGQGDTIALYVQNPFGVTAAVKIYMVGWDPSAAVAPIEASSVEGVTLTLNEQTVGDLTGGYVSLSTAFNPNGDPLSVGCRLRLYALLGGADRVLMNEREVSAQEAATTQAFGWLQNFQAGALEFVMTAQGRLGNSAITVTGILEGQTGGAGAGGGGGGGGKAFNFFGYGDSYVDGLNATPPETNGFMALTIAALGTTWTGNYLGRPAFSATQLLKTRISDTSAFRLPEATNVMMPFAWINEINQGVSQSQMERNIEMICQGARNAGWRVICPTTPVLVNEWNGSQIAQMIAVNAWIVANWPRFADELADFAANANIGTENNTYFTAGHWNNLGHALAESILTPIVQAAGVLDPLAPTTLPFNLSGEIMGWWGAYNSHRQDTGGGTVNVDKDCSSRGANLLQSVSNKQPTLGVQGGNQNVLTYDGVNDEMVALGVPYYDLPTAGTFSIAIVMQLLAVGSAPGIACFPPGTFEVRGFASTGEPSATNNTSQIVSGSSIAGDGKNHLILATFYVDQTAAKTVCSLSIDGVPIGSSAATPAALQTLVADLYVGSRNGVNFANMISCEQLQMEGLFTEEDIQKLYSYMVTRWNVTSGTQPPGIAANTLETAGGTGGAPEIRSISNTQFNATNVGLPPTTVPFKFISGDGSVESWYPQGVHFTMSRRRTRRLTAIDTLIVPGQDDVIEVSATGHTVKLPGPGTVGSPLPKDGDSYSVICSAVGAALVTIDGDGNNVILAGASGTTQTSASGVPLTVIWSPDANAWLAAAGW